MRSQWKPLRTLKVFVVSADWDGKMEYTLQVAVMQFGRAPNADATLAAIASNVGDLCATQPESYPERERERWEKVFSLASGVDAWEKTERQEETTVAFSFNIWTREVALSATAVDKEGAQVTLDGQHGRGYASAVLKLNPSAPYKKLKIRVEAADEVTALDYVLVVAMTEHSKWAMLEDLVVPGCEGGLRPKFEIDVFRYRCLLNNEAQVFKVIPTVMWMPGFDQKLQISIQDKEWTSGNVFQQPLNDEGKAEVDIAVLASDRKHKAIYYVSAQGSPLKERGRLFTTLEPPPKEAPPTPLPKYRFRSTTPSAPSPAPTPPPQRTPRPRPGDPDPRPEQCPAGRLRKGLRSPRHVGSTRVMESLAFLAFQHQRGPSVAPAVPMSLRQPR
ncbi:TCEA1 [Symbiodinium necroappetens]|uniref:TCEA1 protein n=1 Tax=Symbiodinium necroappetens TaxID=1628268 RepID=A0A812TX99_9DINO|nr:TCEA1 [Symbiodinium necroappetens]